MGRRRSARLDADGDRDRHVTLVDQIVEYGRRFECQTVEAHIDAGRPIGGVLRRHIDGYSPGRAGIHLGIAKGELECPTLRHTGLRQGVRARHVLVVWRGRIGRRDELLGKCDTRNEEHHQRNEMALTSRMGFLQHSAPPHSTFRKKSALPKRHVAKQGHYASTTHRLPKLGSPPPPLGKCDGPFLGCRHFVLP